MCRNCLNHKILLYFCINENNYEIIQSRNNLLINFQLHFFKYFSGISVTKKIWYFSGVSFESENGLRKKNCQNRKKKMFFTGNILLQKGKLLHKLITLYENIYRFKILFE